MRFLITRHIWSSIFNSMFEGGKTSFAKLLSGSFLPGPGPVVSFPPGPGTFGVINVFFRGGFFQPRLGIRAACANYFSFVRLGLSRKRVLG